MKTRTMVATLLIAAAASADARFASPYPRKTVSPDEVGHWIVITSNPWPHSAGSDYRIPTRIVVNETAVKGSNLLSDPRSEALLPQLAPVASK